MKKIIKRAMSMLLCSLIILACIPPSPAKAATPTIDNAVIFTVRGSIDAGEVRYIITVDGVYNQTYQSFNITYPKELVIAYKPSFAASTWNTSNTASGNTKTTTFIFSGSGSRSAALLQTDLEDIYFILENPPDVFPPENSRIAIQASASKVTAFQDAEGYVHYYTFIASTTTNWLQAYNEAKNSYMQDPRYPDDPTKRLQGYLATLTTHEEQMKVYRDIATQCGWLGGTRMLLRSTGEPILDLNSLPAMAGQFNSNFITNSDASTPTTQYWYWACGPEAGNIFFNEARAVGPPNGRTPIPGTETSSNVPVGFTGWSYYSYFGSKEPNNSDTTTRDGNLGGEYVLQFAFTGASHPTGADLLPTDPNYPSILTTDPNYLPPTSRWNDYSHANQSSIAGYYIEYGGYPGDPKADELGGSEVTTSSEVELVMPIIVQYRSTVIDSYDSQGNPVYRQISHLSIDRVQTYENHLPYTAVRINTDITWPLVPSTISGYSPYGFKFFGQPDDESLLTTNAVGDVSGFHSNHTQRIVFLYKPDSYTVTFNANFTGWNSANVSPGSKTVQFDSPYGALASATRPGHTLTGWYTSQSNANTGTSPVNSGDLVTTTGDHILYAGWVENSSYIIHYDLNDTTSEPAVPTSVADKTGVSWTDSGLLPAAPTRAGYVFTGWDVTANGTKQGVTASDTYGSLAASDAEPSITLQAQWRDAQYIWVIYHLNGAQTPASLTDEQYDVDTELVPLPEATRQGYTFDGWKVVDDGEGHEATENYDNSDGKTYGDLAAQGARYIVVEAQWTPKPYAISYDRNDPTTNPYGASVTGPIWEQNGFVPPASVGNPTRSGYLFMGWNTQSDGMGRTANVGSSYSQLAGGDDTVGSITLYAQWQPEREYYVRYDSNGGSPASISDKIGVLLDASGLLPAADPTPPPGYDFAAWTVTYNGTKSGVTSADTFGGLADDPNAGYIVLQAQYSPKQGYIVNYNLNGSPQTGYPTQKTDIVWTQSFLLPNIDPVQAGQTFLGWNTVAGGTGISATNADTYGALAGGIDTPSIILYAQWAEDTVYTVRYELNGGTSSVQNVELNPLDDVPVTPQPTPPAGYIFDRWVVVDNGYGTNTNVTVNGSQTFADLVYGDGTVVPYRNFIVLRALYTEKDDFTVVYDWNDGAVPTTETVTGVKWTDSGFTPHSATQPGKNLIGWTIDQAGAGSYVLPATQYKTIASNNDAMTSVTLYAQWEASYFIVRYDLNGVTPPTGNTDYNQKTVGFDDQNLIPPVLKRVGYELSGWIVSENGAKLSLITNTDSYRSLAAVGAPYITLQAQWTAKIYTVHFDTDGGTPTAISSATVLWSEDHFLPATIPSKPGYTFLSWKLWKIDSETISGGATVLATTRYSALALYNGMDESNITLQAQYTENANVTITYAAKTKDSAIDDAGGSVSPTSQSVPPATGTASSTATANAGYHLKGWYEASDTTFITIPVTSPTFTPAKDSNGLNVTGSYVALFEEDADVTITYQAVADTGGTGGCYVDTASENVAPATGTVNGSIASAAIGYTFIGWFYLNDNYETDTPISTNAAFVPAKVGGVNAEEEYAAYFVKYYSVPISINKDGNPWTDGSAPVITLKESDTGPVFPQDKLRDGGTYRVYVNGVYTGIDIVYNDPSGATLDFYSVGFDIKEAGDADSSTINATYDKLVITGGGATLSGAGGVTITSGDVVLGSGDLTITATGAGADVRGTYTYDWSGDGTSGAGVTITDNIIGISALSNSVDALCTITGTNHYIVTINVQDEDGNPLEDVDVEIQQFGNYIDGGMTASDGEYQPNPLPDGVYNIVLTYTDTDGNVTTITEYFVIDNDDVNKLVTIPSQYTGRLNSKFEQKAATPVVVVVGNLHKVFSAPPADSDENGVTAEDMDTYNDGGAILIRLEANEVDSADPQKAANDAAVSSDGKEFGFDLDLSAFKDVWEYNNTATKTSLQLDELNSLVTVYINIPAAHQNKTGYVVYRYHDGQVERIPQFPAANSYGEYFEYDPVDQVIILTVRKFSVYTIAYNPTGLPPTLVTITFDANSGSLPPGEPSNVALPMGESYTSPLPTRGGYTLSGWIDDYGYTYPPGAVIVFNFNITLTAQWTRNGGTVSRPPDRTVTVTFNANGGVGDMAHVVVTAHETYKLPESLFTNARYRFVGWKIDNMGETLAAGAEISVDDDITVYAQWASVSTGINLYVNLEDISPLMNTDEHKEYIYGRPNSKFAPEADMTRAEVAQMFYNLLRDKDVEITVSFADVAEDSWYYTAINTLASLGFLGGFPDGLFHPEESITRAQFSAIIVRLAVISPGTVRFSDVPETHWAYDYVNTAAAHGWIQGVGNDLFEPERNISRAEAITLVNRMLGRYPDRDYIDSHTDLVQYSDLDNSHWAYYEVMEASNAHDFERYIGGEFWQ